MVQRKREDCGSRRTRDDLSFWSPVASLGAGGVSGGGRRGDLQAELLRRGGSVWRGDGR